MASHARPSWPRRAWRRLLGPSWPLALARALAVVAAIAIGGLLFVAAGGMPIAASEGHWSATRMFLKFVMRRSVSTSTVGIEVPPLDDPAMALKGAGHYATSCMPCHGAPGHPRPLVVRRMVPEPPYLPALVDTLQADELFWVVKHGIKYTAMPAWVAQERDDEVWAMVAFLQRLPRLDAARFDAMAYGERAGELRGEGASTGLAQAAAPRPRALDDCVRCHGSDGAGRGDGAFPRLAGQSADYLRASLAAYAQGSRHSGVMQPVAAELDEGEIARLARHFQAQRGAAGPARGTDDAAALARGRALAMRGAPERRIPSCVECHGPGADARNPYYPELAGQYPDYLMLQLRLFQRGERGGTGYAQVMAPIAARLEPGDVRDLALYYASLPGR